MNKRISKWESHFFVLIYRNIISFDNTVATEEGITDAVDLLNAAINESDESGDELPSEKYEGSNFSFGKVEHIRRSEKRSRITTVMINLHSMIYTILMLFTNI